MTLTTTKSPVSAQPGDAHAAATLSCCPTCNLTVQPPSLAAPKPLILLSYLANLSAMVGVPHAPHVSLVSATGNSQALPTCSQLPTDAKLSRPGFHFSHLQRSATSPSAYSLRYPRQHTSENLRGISCFEALAIKFADRRGYFCSKRRTRCSCVFNSERITAQPCADRPLLRDSG